MCWETDFPRLFLVRRCGSMFLSAIHLPIPRKGGLRGKVDGSLPLCTWVQKRNQEACVLAKIFEGGDEGTPTRCIRVNQSQAISQKQFLALAQQVVLGWRRAGRGWMGKKKERNSALILSKG